MTTPAVSPNTPAATAPPTFPLHTGKGLTVAETSTVLGRSPAHVVIIAGEAESGKSTLLATLYEQYVHGAFGGFQFAGSLTLQAFDERAHDSRIASMRTTPTTPRTSSHDGIRFLHLRVAPDDGGDAQDLLISDLAGELFESLRSSTDALRQFAPLRRADSFVSVVDGEALVDVLRRHRAVAKARDFVRSVLDAKLLPSGASVQMVLTKWDVVAGSAEKAAAEAQWEELVSRTRELCVQHSVHFEALKTSARSSTAANVSAAYGIADALRLWTVSSLGRRKFPATDFVPHKIVREIDRFGVPTHRPQVPHA
ncbi:MAG: hypothetical protein QM783_15910 [Phycisphaerales bacterium]